MGGIGSGISKAGDWAGEVDAVDSVEVEAVEYTDTFEYGMGGMLYTILSMFMRSA